MLPASTNCGAREREERGTGERGRGTGERGERDGGEGERGRGERRKGRVRRKGEGQSIIHVSRYAHEVKKVRLVLVEW